MAVVKNRPTETLTGLSLIPATYGACVQVGVSQAVAAVVAVVAGVVPHLVSQLVDAVRGRREEEF